jgi:broad specificity phosphatase PhoE
MITLYLIRHGEASAGWGEEKNPGLSDLGRRQAHAAADTLAALGPLPIIASPLKRCLETAQIMADRWHVTPTIENRVAEIPSPEGIPDRSAWLHSIMQGNWREAGVWLQPWRQNMIDCVTALKEDTVIHSHFVASNVIVGHAAGDDRVVYFQPDNCSITKLGLQNGRLSLLELGRDRTTKIN